MLSRDAKVEGFAPADWRSLRRILSHAFAGSGAGSGAGQRSGAARDGAAAGGLIVVTGQDRVVAAYRVGQGRVDPPKLAFLRPLDELGREASARWVLRLDQKTLRDISGRFGRRLARSDDLWEQVQKLVEIVQEFVKSEDVECYPPEVATWVVPSARVRERALDVFCPVGRTLLFGAFDGPDLLTSVALHRAASGFDRIVGPEHVRREMGLRSGQFARDARGVARAVELSVGALSFGAFAEAKTWERLLSGVEPGAWARAVAARDVVFHPFSAGLAVPFGVDVGRIAFRAARDLASRLAGSGVLAASPQFGGVIERAMTRVAERADATFAEDLWSLFRFVFAPAAHGSSPGSAAPRASAREPEGTG